MEFSSRGFQRSPQPAAASTAAGGGSHTPERSPRKKGLNKLRESKSFMILWVVFFASITILVLAIIFSFATRQKESGLVNKDLYQAVFLNNGQAYFGKVKDINSSYIDLQDIYYLYNGSTDGQNAAQNLSLVKLGTELHCPKDQMIIYRDQVTFWENLDKEGKVAVAIKDWKDQNPKGADCSSTTQQNTQQSTSPQQTDSETPPSTPSDGSSNSDGSTTTPDSPDDGNL